MKRTALKRAPFKRAALREQSDTCTFRVPSIKRKRPGKPRRVSVVRDKIYLAELRHSYCTVGMLHGSEGCSMVSDAAHGPVNGMGSKGPDNEAITLCRHHHREQHAIGWRVFENKYGFNRAKVAATNYAAYLSEKGAVR